MTKDLSPQELETIEAAIDFASDEYTENNRVIFANESERAKHHFGTVKRGLKGWSKSGLCMVPGCGKRSIARSHVIPKAMSLAAIDEGGHLVTPIFNHQVGEVRMEKVGISDATTFPGFCANHERLFEDFETKKSIRTEQHVCLQAYRIACRELFRTKFLLEQHEWTMSSYCRVRDEGLLRLVRDHAHANGLRQNVDFKSLSLKDDPLVLSANDHIAPVRRLATHIETLILPALERAVFNGDDADISIDAMNIDMEIPVALAGSASFYVDDDGDKKEVTTLMNVLPYADNTLLILATAKCSEKYLRVYKARWMNHALDFISLVESWMTNGTDQWYLKPSIWSSLGNGRQAALLQHLFDSEQNIGEECPLSIFDDIRTQLINISEIANATNKTPEYLAYVDSQRSKMI